MTADTSMQTSQRVDLSANTNLWGCAPTVSRALEGAFAGRFPYPATRTAEPLRAALAETLQLTPDMVTTGCGSDDVLATAFRVLARPGEAVAAPVPAFSTAQALAVAAGLHFSGCAFGPGFSLPGEALLGAGAAVAYLCSPNNPTGTRLAKSDIRALLDRFPGPVILDEAYIDFDGDSGVDLVRDYDQLLVVRTFSKAYGLAGLRVGYGVGSSALIARMEEARGPYKVSAPAELAAVTSLQPEARAWVREAVEKALGGRDVLQGALRARGIGFVPSQANFVLVPVPDAAALATRLDERGYTVRPFLDLPGLGDAVRITVGPESLMRAVAEAVAEALAEALQPDPSSHPSAPLAPRRTPETAASR